MDEDDYKESKIAKEGLETELFMIDYLNNHRKDFECLGCIANIEHFDSEIEHYRKLQKEGYGDAQLLTCSGIFNIEIKRDNYISKTPNILVEWACLWSGKFSGKGWFHYLKPEVRFLLMYNPETRWLYIIDYEPFKYRVIECMAEDKARPTINQKVKGKSMLNFLIKEELLNETFWRYRI